ncbi:MAG: 50S ribosomal protein L10 [Thaumarchaeota archaeon]|nr:50S ribosomal protein L10 [Nitrososphaerota archaeon]
MRTQVVQYPARKVQQVDRTEELSKKYGLVAASRLNKVRAAQLMSLKRDFRGSLEIAIAKNTLAAIGLKKTGRAGIEQFVDELKGQNALIFTDFNPFKLYLIFEKNKVNLPARAGDVATEDVVITAGNTGLAPGPVLSEFKEAGVPTKIDAGSIWITKDTVVARPGDVINPKMAGFLARMGLKPIRAGVSIYLANFEGKNLREQDVRIDLEEYRGWLATARNEALSLALGAAYPSKEVLPMLLAKGFAHAKGLAASAGYVSKDTVGDVLGRGHVQASALLQAVKAKGYS